ncbi:DUF202 domain-containing protein [Mucilaginibacter rubeus]|uniref:DUF202 domain-containing protein n=1 Tax=Mucilaginibacter rubeus TaxID=2027860 RepID=A0AAE6JKD0_9SPHI|nr:MULTISPECIES: DUF202 domain-containing protein [Mucilaginibacter]QEM06450.1 DUF202 domain-containing protein [Mucilaginibacter rubeus]QEM19036.1 DUF202 domain-containing protein [Mucilaginibacter gossypii]QTE44423.1 DUF202 domain-containing protein [Mucilaginibacter rubeus]QTE51022.1 DUF202 domain-containing protein [Mucilaginibacter rubeus]QTE56105.1 DUF202 domain-containing protein [Mucilaginibacter rubeus]
MDSQQQDQYPVSPGDHLANERTFLAWIRTSIAVMAFGFVVVKFALFIKQISVVLAGKVILPGKGYSASIGIILVGIGAVMALMAFLRYRETERQLLNRNYKPSHTLLLMMTLAIIGMSVMLIYYLLPSI